MTVTIINATMREEVSYNIAKVLAGLIAGDDGIIYEILLPRNLPGFCTGCTECFYRGESHCPQAAYVSNMEKAIEDSHIIIFASPIYGYHIPASLKNFFDHFSFRYIHRRPSPSMWSKQGVIITSRSFTKSRYAERDIIQNITNWGIGKFHKLSFKTDRLNWDEVRPYDKLILGNKLEKLAKNILSRTASPTGLMSKLFFHKGRLYQKLKNKNKLDTEYWGEKGWLDIIRPWYIKRPRK